VGSFATKLSRLPAPQAPSAKVESASPSGEREASLARLREKMASIIARDRSAPRPAAVIDAERSRETSSTSWIEHAFVEEQKPHGPLYVTRKPTPLGHRVGHVQVCDAHRAEPALLALLALDPSLAHVDLRRALYLDTETTGLAGGTGTVPFLLGLGYFEDASDSLVVEQVLLRKYAHEPAMVEHLRERLEAASVIVTFNGKAFDMSLLRARTTMNRLPALPERPHLDLLHVARRIHKHRLASCSLVKLEDRILGRARVGDVAGADIAAIYHHFVRTRDVSALEVVIEHNALDVISMVALVGLYGEPLSYTASQALASQGITAEPPTADSLLSPSDVAMASVVLRRAGDFERAHAVASASIDRGAGARGYKVRGDIEKARGDKARALSDYEAAASELAGLGARGSIRAALEETVDLRALHLELAKLYEHHARAYDKALEIVARGTLEVRERSVARAQRLVRKREKTLAARESKPSRQAKKRV